MNSDDKDIYKADPQTRKKSIQCKPELVITSLQKFYSNHPEINKIIPYLTGNAPLSLRIIDWFVTKYSRNNCVHYPLNGQDFLVYLSYKGQLKAYSKQYFDPNCRRERIMFKIPGQEQFMTTIGKLNFFKWAMESNILDYIEAHEDELRTGYNAYLKDTIQMQKRSKNNTASSNDSGVTTDSVQSDLTITSQSTAMTNTTQNSSRTTRRRTKQTMSSLNKLQVYTTPIELFFD
jgi:hypothetical protein